MADNFSMPVTDDEMDDIRVTIELEDGEIECAIHTIFEMEGQDYIVLVPVDENDEMIEDAEPFVYRYSEDKDGNPEIANIESEEEFDKVADFFDELQDDWQLQEMLNQED